MADDGSTALVYVVPALALAAVGLWYVYGALDRVGLDAQHAQARVASKLVAPGSTTYHTTTIEGRAWTQASTSPEVHVLTFEISGEPAGAAVSPEFYASVQTGDVILVEYRRTRFSNRLVATDVRRGTN